MGETKETWQRVDVEASNRCQGITAKGQCVLAQVEPSKFCHLHGGGVVSGAQRRIAVKQYMLDKAHVRARTLTNDSQIKGLRGEIGILRMILETQIDRCPTPTQLAVAAPSLSDMIMKIQKLVTSCHRLEEAMGHTLDQDQLAVIADSIIQVIGDYITDETQLKEIAGRIGEAIAHQDKLQQ